MTPYRTYQALIKSVADYGAGLYDPGSKKQWAKIETLHNEALRICLGAMKSSPIAALQV